MMEIFWEQLDKYYKQKKLDKLRKIKGNPKFGPLTKSYYNIRVGPKKDKRILVQEQEMPHFPPPKKHTPSTKVIIVNNPYDSSNWDNYNVWQ